MPDKLNDMEMEHHLYKIVDRQQIKIFCYVSHYMS